MRIQKGDRGSRPLLKNHKNIDFLSNSGTNPLKNHKFTKPTFNVVPSSTRQRNAILMAFRWRANDGPLIMVFGSSHPSSTKKRKNKIKRCQSWPPLPKFSGSVQGLNFIIWWFVESDCFIFIKVSHNYHQSVNLIPDQG